jgi:iron(III) transport system ATP-binding protein
MSEGHLQQVGSPNDIYDRPANRFVAQFVGSPPINIIELPGGNLSTLGKIASEYFATRHAELSGVGSIGIRPESIRIAGPDAPAPHGALSGKAEVTGVLPTGGSWIVELSLSGEKLFMTTHQSPEIKVGDGIDFFVKAKALHVFDGQGNRLAEADKLLAAAKVH